MLEGSQIQVLYGNKVILSSLSFQFQKYGLILLTGPSGSGKTTFLQMLNLWIPFQGQLRFNGISLHPLDDDKRLQFRQERIGCVYQEHGLLLNLSVKNHMELVQTIKGHYQSPYVKKAWEEFLLEVPIDQRVKTLSRGQRQRLAILLACFGQSEILLLDEPTTGLDKANRLKIYALLSRLQLERCIVMSTHIDLNEPIVHTQHLQLPLSQAIQAPILSKLRNQFPPKTVEVKLPTLWLWKFHLHQRKLEKFRWRFQFFQSLTFALLGIVTSLMFVLNQEVLSMTKKMLGGSYQWIEPNKPFVPTLQSTNEFDSIFTTIPFTFSIRSDYDDNFFESLKPFQRFSFDNHAYQYVMKDFHLGLINHARPIPEGNSMVSHNSLLRLDTVMLGVQPIHLLSLSKLLHCFPNQDDINKHLKNQLIQIDIQIYKEDWGYHDELVFDLIAIQVTEKPTWFHSLKNYPQWFYETRMRLPTKGIEDTTSNQPWLIPKTMLIETKEHTLLIDLWRNHPDWRRYHLHHRDQFGWRLYRQENINNPVQALALHQTRHHFHSTWGYHYYPEQRLSGFAHPIFFSAKREVDQVYLETLQKLSDPYAWIAVEMPLNIDQGFILANPSNAIKYQVQKYSDLSIGEIYISEPLAKHWKVKPGDIIHLVFPIYDQNLQAGVLGDYGQGTLTIRGIESNREGYWIYQNQGWWEDWLMMHAFIPSLELLAKAYIVYESIAINDQFRMLNPFQEVQQSVHEIQAWLMIGLIILLIVFGLPSWILFYYYLRQSLIDDRKTIRTLIGFGSPVGMMRHWYKIRLQVLIVELAIPSLILMIGFDSMLKEWFAKAFYTQIAFQLPYLTIGILISGFLCFYGLMLSLQNHEIRTLQKII